MLIHLPHKWLKLLHCIYQKCYEEGIVPTIWKQSLIIPILKQGKPRTEPSNYRPISFTSQIGKVLEKMVLSRLAHYCEKQTETSM